MKLQSAGPLALVLVALLSLPSAALAAAHRVDATPEDLANAINKADPQAVPYRGDKISPEDIQVGQCVGPSEDPTHFECTWKQHVDTRWVQRRTWLVIDALGWHVIVPTNY
jgi:hypothetical protein